MRGTTCAAVVAATILAATTAAAAPAAAAAAPAAAAAAPAAAPTYSPFFTAAPAVTAASCAASSSCINVNTANRNSSGKTYAVDSTGVRDSDVGLQAALNDAAAAANVTRQWTVYLPAGTYLEGAPLRLKSNVVLAGSGNGTVLLLDRSHWGAFGYSSLIGATQGPAYKMPDGGTAGTFTGVNDTVRDLTVNGNYTPVRPADAGTPAGGVNQGGGIATGNGWHVTGVRFTNFNYFKLWINNNNAATPVDPGTTTVADHNKFDNLGLGGKGTVCASGEDNIGGGGYNNRVVVDHNEWDSTIVGNALDLTRGQNVTVTNNTLYGGRTVACVQRDGRVSGSQHSMYLEGIRGAANLVSGNALLANSGLVLQSNAGYLDAVVVDNPLNTTVSNNTIVGSADVGVVLNYNRGGGAGVAPTTAFTPGGHNTVTGNTIIGAARWGVLDVVLNAADQVLGDTISNNRVVDSCGGCPAAPNTGEGSFDPVGIAVASGTKDTISGNSVVDTRTPAAIQYGVELGYTNRAVAPVSPTVMGNTTSGIAGDAAHFSQLAAPAATALSATASGTATTLRWNGGVMAPGAAAASGFHVYRAGALLGSVSLSSDVRGVLDSGSGQYHSTSAGWRSNNGAALASAAAPTLLGGGSLAITAAAAGNVDEQQAVGTPVTGGATYSASAAFRAATTGRSVQVAISWYGPSGKISTSWDGVKALDTAGGWSAAYLTAVAPPAATTAYIRLVVDGAAAGEVHYADRVALVAGSGVESLPVAPAAAAGHPLFTVTSDAIVTDSGRSYPQATVARLQT